jgi:hypothetical protein
MSPKERHSSGSSLLVRISRGNPLSGEQNVDVLSHLAPGATIDATSEAGADFLAKCS